MSFLKRVFIVFIIALLVTSCKGELSLSGSSGAAKVGSSKGDLVTFIADVTIPDFTQVKPGQEFIKTWRLMNSGSTTWTTDYDLVFYSGAEMGADKVIPLPKEVKPGEMIDLSVDMVAPSTVAQYRGDWMLRNEDGDLFGWGMEGDQCFYVVITVSEATSPLGGSTTGSGDITISSIDLTVTPSSYKGGCPVVVNINGTIFSQGKGDFVYKLEAGTSTSGFTFYLPSPASAIYKSSGSHRLDVSYSLQMNDPVNGWVRIAVISPVEFNSDAVTFSIKCD